MTLPGTKYHCPHGHLRTPENTYSWTKDGITRSMCIACRANRQRAYRATHGRNEDATRNRERVAAYYAQDPEKFRTRARRNHEELVDSYVRSYLRIGFEGNAAFREALRTPEGHALIKLKRAQLKLKRLIRWLEKQVR